MDQPIVKLVWVDDPRYEYPLSQGPFVIGRDETCNLPLHGNTKASRRHAEIIWYEGQFWVRDLGSHNGTRVNGQKITQEMLYDGDAVGVGGLRFRFVNPYMPAPPDRARLQNSAVAAPPDDDATGTVLQMPVVKPPPKNKTVLIASITGALVLLMLAVYALTAGGGGASQFPDAALYGELRLQVGEPAIVTLPFANMKKKNAEIFRVGAVPNDSIAMRIEGAAQGSGELYVLSLVDKKTWYRLKIIVQPKEPWPAGWEDDDRQKEANKAVTEADVLFKNRLDFPTMLKAYYLYHKASRLYLNCKLYNPENDRIQANMHEFAPELDMKEFELTRDLKTAMLAGDNAKAKEIAGQLMRLFPPDGAGTTVMASHGDPVKNRQYSMLNDFLAAQSSGSK